jgi:hypothetical protein
MKKVEGMKIKNIILIILSVLNIIGISGCQKVINIDLNEAAPRIVIEGLVTDRRGSYMLTISKSGSYFNQPLLQTVSGATALITDNGGFTDTLKESGPGIYYTQKLKGFPGNTYTLKVIAEDQTYEATSTMMSHVTIDSLKVFKSLDEGFGLGGNQNDNRYEIHCFFKDPPEKNYYRIRIFKNDSINTENYRLYDDQYTNGEFTELRVAHAAVGNTYRVELLSLDKSTYGYFHTLEDLIFTNPFFGSTPANPDTNLSNGALGYFGAAAISSRTIVVTKALIQKAEQ